ncbi:MAG: hypothetical protein RLO01_12085 [Thalassobaculaceae bacterium]
MIPRHHIETAARLSRDIYRDLDAFRDTADLYGVEIGAWFDHGDTQAALCRGRDYAAAYLVFRGTQPRIHQLQDVLTNLAVYPSRWAGAGRAHAGYVAALGRVRYQARLMAERVASSIPLYVAGHSMGGALATLYADWVSADVPDRHRLAGLITFGAPAAATMEAHRPMLERMPVERFVMPGDLARLWPPVLFRHPGPARRLAPISWWPGPLSRHDMGDYALSLCTEPSQTKDGG